MQRPTGITILAILAFIGGIFGLLGALALFGVSAFYPAATDVAPYGAFAGVVALVYSVLSLVLAWGFWTLQSWAWPVGVGLQLLGVLSAFLRFFDDTSQFVGLVISLVIPAIILWYLYQPHVKAAFGRS